MSARSYRTPESTTEGPSVAPPTAAPSIAPAQDADEVHALFDSPAHHGIGDAVSGEGITVGPVSFTPGECASLVDFVGSLVNLERFDDSHLLMIKALVSANIEDSSAWDAATDGMYSQLAQNNEGHFAGAGGFGANFASAMAMALQTAKDALAEEEGSEANVAVMNRARMHLYTAEHYLQDSFSAGHQFDPADLDAALDLSDTDLAAASAMVPLPVFLECHDVISCYAIWTPVATRRIDDVRTFESIGVLGAALKGRDGVLDGLRKAAHEELEGGVEVSSEAHPEPWVLGGDHDLGSDPVGQEAMIAALSEARNAVAHVTPTTDPAETARALHDRHLPKPTGAGQAKVDAAVAKVTADVYGVAQGLVVAMSRTIVDVMETVCRESGGAVVRLDELPEERQDHPKETPDFGEPGTPEHSAPAPAPAPDVSIDPVVDLPMGDQHAPGWWTDPDQHPDAVESGQWADRSRLPTERPNPWWATAE
jgi:hypothetical protein